MSGGDFGPQRCPACGEPCQHKTHEEHLLCAGCGHCTEDLDARDLCPACRGRGARRPLAFCTVTGGLAEVLASPDVDVVQVDYDVLESEYVDLDELRAWIADARSAGRALDGRLPEHERTAARRALAEAIRTARGSLRQLLRPGRGGDRGA